jgi:hypothetical protein
MPMKWALYDTLRSEPEHRRRCALDLFRAPDARGERI